MIGSKVRKLWYAVALTLLVAGGLTGCNLFGQQAAMPATPTLPPPPTETPLPALPTLTPTPTTPVLPTPTATKVVSPDSARATLTPTTEPPAEVGGSQPAEQPSTGEQQVSYVVRTVSVVGDTIVNGSFEEGFDENGVATGWQTFDNGGVGKRTWMPELDPIHVSHGEQAQLMQLTGAGNVDRYIGIYQTVEVIPGETYTLTLHGLIRSSDAGNVNTPFGHRIEWGVDYQGQGYWPVVEEWFDTGWNDVKLDDRNPTMNYLSLPIEAKSDKLTFFIRGWTKWPTQPIAKFYIDGVSLTGPMAGEEEVIRVVTTKGEEGMPTTGGSAIWLPVSGALLVIGFALWEVRKIWKPTA
jgi:hypothetical protein